MNNDYQDYQLEDMEDNAINKSNNFKKAAIIGGAVLGVGGTAAYAATKLNDGTVAETESELTSEDLMDGANAAAIDSEVIDETTTSAPAAEEVHHHHHHYHNDNVKPAPAEVEDPEVVVEETGIIYDEEGNVVSVFDRGTIDGKDFTVMDTDGNGYADKIGYDINGNGVYEANEIADMDNRSYQMGQGQTLGQYVQDNEGNLYVLQEPQPFNDNQNPNENGFAQNEPEEKIHNDFIDEKNDGQFDDVARNNPDYNNNYDHDYGESQEQPHAGLAYVDNVTEDDSIENDNYAYGEVNPSLHEEIDGTAEFNAEDPYDGMAYEEPSYDTPSYEATDDLASNDYSDDASFTDTVDFV